VLNHEKAPKLALVISRLAPGWQDPPIRLSP